ncbi:tegument protein VP22 [Cervid alphaherpesvirus 1]|uniref:Tegument protein VP22 n=1 Tax=Cervid alphaherpesvirus 1 TaxID=79891 RepID=A0A455JIS7_9ALPH|nr:tegument protein VP22 [Cervid alphaherpesvirus 1]AVT50661.1 tegument protein VP22 [Cervid alphaherpesvirus 1]
MARFHRPSEDEDDYEYSDFWVRENSLYGYESDPDDHVYEELRAASSAPAPDGRREGRRPRAAVAAIQPTVRGRERERAAAAAEAAAAAPARRQSSRASSRPRRAAEAPSPQPPARGASVAAAVAAPARTRAPPGANAVASGRPLAFSAAPKTPKSPWCGPTHAYNRTIFCEAVALVAAEYARQAAASVWDSDPPKSNERLDRMLKSAAIRILVCEGAGLLAAANDVLAARARRAARAGTGTGTGAGAGAEAVGGSCARGRARP